MYFAEPGDFPLDIIVASISASALQINWKPPLVPSGIIIAYTLYARYDNGSKDEINVNGSSRMYVLGNLSPHQLVHVQMSASTIAGEGPTSAEAHNRTSQAGVLIEIH